MILILRETRRLATVGGTPSARKQGRFLYNSLALGVLKSLRRPNIRGTRSLLSLSDIEINAVAFLKMIETTLLHFRMMEKQIPLIRFDEPETTIANDFLDLALGHNLAPLNKAGF